MFSSTAFPKSTLSKVPIGRPAAERTRSLASFVFSNLIIAFHNDSFSLIDGKSSIGYENS